MIRNSLIVTRVIIQVQDEPQLSNPESVVEPPIQNLSCLMALDNNSKSEKMIENEN